MTLPESVIYLRLPGDTTDSDKAAVLDKRGGLVLEPGESILFTNKGDLTIAGVGKLADTPIIHATTHRIVWIDPKYNGGGGWVGFGAGALVAAAANAVSSQRAKSERAGRVAVITARYEWISAMALTNEKPLLGALESFLDLHVQTSNGLQHLRWWRMRSSITRENVPQIAVAAANRWQQIGRDILTTEELARLVSYAAGDSEDDGKRGSKGWTFPDIDQEASTHENVRGADE